MGTGSNDEGRRGGFEEEAEPLGLAATAHDWPRDPRPRASVPPEHQEAVELIAQARRQQGNGREEEVRALFRQAAELELQVLKTVKTQPEQGLIAELGARAAIQAGKRELAREILRKGASAEASEALRWALLLASIEVDLLELVHAAFEERWQVPWASEDEAETRILLVGRDGRRLLFDLDPEVSSVRLSEASRASLRFTLPAARPDWRARRALEGFMMPWFRPKRRVQNVVLDRRGLRERLLPDFVPV